MDELLIQLLLGLVEIFFEVFIQFTGEALLDLLSRAAADVFKPVEPPHGLRTFFACGFLGTLAGAGSLVIFPHPLFHPSKIRGVSLIISPVITGLGMSALGAMLRRRGKRVVETERFPYAYAFAFGMALVRLVFASS
jgi:hypothetical protein